MKVLGIARSGERFRTRTFSEKLTLVAVGNETVPLIFYQAPKLPKMLPKFYTSLFINVDELLGRHVGHSAHQSAGARQLIAGFDGRTDGVCRRAHHVRLKCC